jgi:TonB family protein
MKFIAKLVTPLLCALLISSLVAATPERKPTARPKLAEIISDGKYLRGALGTKALLATDLSTGEASPELLADIKAAGLAESVQFIPLPKEAVQPKPKSRVAPVYPESLHRKGVGGEVRFLFVIGADGTVKGIYCSYATSPEFALAAAAALTQWRFEPCRIQGTAVPLLVTQTLKFEPN